MTISEFAADVAGHLPYEPNHQQTLLISALARFCSSATPSDSVFILNGYAGTGKTSLTGALVKSLPTPGARWCSSPPQDARPKCSRLTPATPHRPSIAASTAADREATCREDSQYCKETM